jgi:hypothetical protein
MTKIIYWQDNGRLRAKAELRSALQDASRMKKPPDRRQVLECVRASAAFPLAPMILKRIEELCHAPLVSCS